MPSRGPSPPFRRRADLLEKRRSDARRDRARALVEEVAQERTMSARDRNAFLRALDRRKRTRRKLPTDPDATPAQTPKPPLVSQGPRTGGYPRRQRTPDDVIREAIARSSGRVWTPL
jgi:hypothetical protein